MDNEAESSNSVSAKDATSSSDIQMRREKFLAPSLRTFTAFSDPLVLVEGKGQYVWDEEGRKHLDCLSQNLTISVGYGNPVVQAAVVEQYAKIEHVTTMFYHPGPGQFAEEVVGTLPKGQDWVVHFVNSGAEAIDLAVLLARTYTQSMDVVCLRDSYHGLHFTAMGATGMHACRQPIAGSPGFLHVASPNQYRGVFGSVTEPYAQEVENAINAGTPGRVAGILLEPIQGYTGVVPLPKSYVHSAVDRVRAAGGLYIADEVQTGFGRTGEHFWGFEYHEVVPDVVVMGKGMGNGFPVSGVAVRREVAETMCDRKFFNTFGSNPVGCAAGRAVLKVLEDEDTQANASRVGGLIKRGLGGLAETHGGIGDVRGRGLMLGVELVEDKETKVPATEYAQRVHQRARELGLIMGRAGPYGSVLRICPPMCITEEDVGWFLSALEEALEA